MGLIPISDRGWSLTNTDDGEEVRGDYEAEGITRNVSASYGETHALNSQIAVTQFLHGNSDTLSFQATFFDDSVAGFAGITGAVEAIQADLAGGPVKALEKLEKLEEWARRIDDLQRPAIVLFVAGDGSISQLSIIESLDSIQYGPLGLTGEPKLITLTINLRQFVPVDFEELAGEFSPPTTRYHRVKYGEYAELVAHREYKKPLFGDVIRRIHDRNQIWQTSDIIKLPSFAAIRTEVIKPRSLQLSGLTSKKASPQKTLREYHFDRLNRTFSSKVIPEGI